MHAFKIPVVPDENPRWTRCRHAIGREPKGWEFMVWMAGCWNAFRVHLHVSRLDPLDDFQDAFDRFQDEGVSAGRWPTPDGHLPPLGETEAA